MGSSRPIGCLVACLAVLTLAFVSPQLANGALDYNQMVDQIRGFFDDALTLYKQGNAEEAKLKAQAAYFEVFENLEGPIRVNISAKKNFILEQEFTGIRKMIVTGESPEAIGKRMNALVAELGKVVDQLKGGHELKAEATEEPPKTIPGVERQDAGQARDVSWEQVSSRLLSEMDKAISLYEKGDTVRARTLVQDSYFDIFEATGMEAKVGARDPAFKAQLERHFTTMVSQMKKGAPVADVRGVCALLKTDLGQAVTLLGKGADSPWVLFSYSLLIILREGFEAILIITAIIAFLVKTGHTDKLKVIYSGVITALILSVITAILAKWVFKASAASQEVLEGVTMLLAALGLFSVSYWLISKAEAQRWISFIQSKVSDSLSSGSMKTLWFAAFLAVYREGAETILFYQALMAGQSSSGITISLTGFGVGCVLLVALYVVMRYGAVKLPIRPFFMVTSAVIYYMAFVFTGKGVMELIEGKVVDPSLISWLPTIPLLGFYPYWETLLPQVLLVIAALVGITFVVKQTATVAREAA